MSAENTALPGVILSKGLLPSSMWWKTGRWALGADHVHVRAWFNHKKREVNAGTNHRLSLATLTAEN